MSRVFEQIIVHFFNVTQSWKVTISFLLRGWSNRRIFIVLSILKRWKSSLVFCVKRIFQTYPFSPPQIIKKKKKTKSLHIYRLSINLVVGEKNVWFSTNSVKRFSKIYYSVFGEKYGNINRISIYTVEKLRIIIIILRENISLEFEKNIICLVIFRPCTFCITIIFGNFSAPLNCFYRISSFARVTISWNSRFYKKYIIIFPLMTFPDLKFLV